MPDESWVRADTQTGGRGRRGRAWLSIPGNLFTSVVVRRQTGEGPPQQLSFVAAVALAAMLDRWIAPDRLSLKWPNDVLLDGVKVAGILLEGGSGATIIGFGVNLAGHPDATERPATSLPAAGIAAPTAAEAADRLAATFADARATWRTYGFDAVRTAWLARAAGLGKPIEARLGSETISGTFTGIASDGALDLTLADASVRRIHAGEVFAL
ncbi:biotin--[acetyl-CoA-carboxylase] ligase [Polymorphobacter sp. PAMC 29334]|uniref:biotin--[acetyl-CoA-carboxylase] ligase n=1 Tax=Polymorphobacter sp. PAMC 29334 TaxID=2862331 RepID=UPI0021063D30|nr:biotin--[acetyl-CoA-carboxylase] ligase [Polymorphobacter sp. PAMC 29334]